MIMDWLAQAGGWSWVVIGLVLLGLELLAPGVFFMWLGLAALAVGGLALQFDLPWQFQLVIFVVAAFASVLAGRYVAKRHSDETTDTPNLNERGARHVGRELTLAEPMVDGQGRAKIGDTLWRTEGPDLPEGAKVRVVEVRSGTLIVEPQRD